MKNNIITSSFCIVISFIIHSPLFAQQIEKNKNLNIHKVEYEGREYAISEEGYISLIEKSTLVTKIIYEDRTYSRSPEGFITLETSSLIDSKSDNIETNFQKNLNSFFISSIYPNPAIDILNLTFVNKNNFVDNIDISIISMEGQEFIYNIVISDSKVVRMDISALDKGFYQIRYFNGSEMQMKKFIKH